MGRGRSLEHHANPPDASPGPRRHRRQRLLAGLGRRHLSVRRGGELEMVVVRLRRFGERRMLPVSELRLEGGRVVVPFTRHQVEDSPGLSTGRHADEDPWRAKTYWYYEDHAVARA